MATFYIAIPSPNELNIVCVASESLACTKLEFRNRFPSVVRCKIDVIECDVAPVAVSVFHDVAALDESFTLLPCNTRYGMYVAYQTSLEYLQSWLLNHVPRVEYHDKTPYMLKVSPPDPTMFVIALDRKGDEAQTRLSMSVPIQTVVPNNIRNDQPEAKFVKQPGILAE